MPDSIQARLVERVKELTALHRMARLLQDTDRPLADVMVEVVSLLPAAWQYPEITEACITWGDARWSTPGFRDTPWRQSGEFRAGDGPVGRVDVVYTAEKPREDEGPFLNEERDLLRSLADMLAAFLQHRLDDAAILASHDRLEQEVAARTASLRRLASEVCLAEERERRRIAENLHDHLGQGLALMKIRLQRLRGDAVLGGHDRALDELVSLSDQAIRYTRDLTFELSPPVLYELGLGAALDWLGDETRRKHGLKVKVKAGTRIALPDDLLVMLWKSARELVHNVVKYAGAGKLILTLNERDGRVRLTVEDDGGGFDFDAARGRNGGGFGLFSIEERLGQMGGGMTVDSRPGRGTKVELDAPLTTGRDQR